MFQYAFQSVDLLVDGVEVDGFADSNAIISAGYNTPQQGHVIGARGEMAVATTRNKSGRISFNLLMTSSWNQVLQIRAQSNVNIALSGNSALFQPLQVMMNDKMGNTVFTGVNGYIPMMPAVTRGSGIGTVTWVMMFEEMVISRGTFTRIGL